MLTETYISRKSDTYKRTNLLAYERWINICVTLNKREYTCALIREAV